GLLTMRYIEVENAEVAKWQVGDWLLDAELGGHDGREIHRDAVLQHVAVISLCDFVMWAACIDQGDQEAGIEKRRRAHSLPLRSFSSQSSGVSAHALVPFCTSWSNSISSQVGWCSAKPRRFRLRRSPV